MEENIAIIYQFLGCSDVKSHEHCELEPWQQHGNDFSYCVRKHNYFIMGENLFGFCILIMSKLSLLFKQVMIRVLTTLGLEGLKHYCKYLIGKPLSNNP